MYVVPNAVDATEIGLLSLIADDTTVTAVHSDSVFVNVARHARQKNLSLLLRTSRRYRTKGGARSAGLLVPPGDQRALPLALRRIATDTTLRSSLSSAGRERAADFSPAAVGRIWLDVLAGAGVIVDSSDGSFEGQR